MTRSVFANELESASNRISDISRADLQIMLRRAALRLRNAGDLVLERDVDDAVMALSVATGMSKQDMISYIIRDWLERGGHLPVGALGDSETGGA